MRYFMDENFLLENRTAEILYHRYAEKLPIIDYHCHISPKEICENKRYHTITEVWLSGDHYKWRALRSCGVGEYYITGTAPDEEKFRKWAEIQPMLIGNPLYHWTHLELQRYFGITEPLNAENAMEIYEKCNHQLAESEMSVRGIIKKSNVKLICTTDDPVDNLVWHKRLAEDADFDVKVLPAFRPDKAMHADAAEFGSYVRKLENVTNQKINSFVEMCEAIKTRIDYFDKFGCRTSDHALTYCFCEDADAKMLDNIFTRAKAGMVISEKEQNAYHTALLCSAAKEYARRGWVMQLHFSCLRNSSSKMFQELGPDTGFDCINDQPNASGLVKLLNRMEQTEALPKTILYSLNPADNSVIGSVIGCFQTNGKIAGKIQQGSAWWFNDNKSGMTEQMRSLMNLGAFGSFIGMLTDSRSFLSYTRHEYFRRILCNLIGELVENGEYPADIKTLSETVRNISYCNAVNYFDFPVEN